MEDVDEGNEPYGRGKAQAEVWLDIYPHPLAEAFLIMIGTDGFRLPRAVKSGRDSRRSA